MRAELGAALASNDALRRRIEELEHVIRVGQVSTHQSIVYEPIEVPPGVPTPHTRIAEVLVAFQAAPRYALPSVTPTLLRYLDAFVNIWLPHLELLSGCVICLSALLLFDTALFGVVQVSRTTNCVQPYKPF